jgi:hypothetical protein
MAVVSVVPMAATPPQLLLWNTAALAAVDTSATSGEVQPQLHVP